MRLTLIASLLFVFSTLLSQGKVDDFQLRNTENRLLSYSDLEGEKLTVIDFWATWCQPCIRSIPRLLDLNESFKNSGVKFIGVSVDGPRNSSKVRPFTRSMGITYPILLDVNSDVMADLMVTAVPTLLIVDQSGNIVYRHEGFNAGDEEIIKEEIDKHLTEN